LHRYVELGRKLHHYGSSSGKYKSVAGSLGDAAESFLDRTEWLTRQKERDSKPPTTLTDLPEELLLPIASLLDQSTSLALALVCRRLTHLALPQIWRSINLSPDSLFAPISSPLETSGDVAVNTLQGKKEEGGIQ
jgi:hypothetical protein